MNKSRWMLGAVLCALFLCGWNWAHAQVPWVVSGKKQGTVASAVQHGTTYVDLQKAARKLGAGVELFARSKQAKITARNFYAILTVGLEDIVLNAQNVRLSAPVMMNGADMFVPVEFFQLASVQKALGKEISFEKNAFYIERPFDFSRTENVVNAKENQLIFTPRRPLTWQTQTPNAHAVTVIFPNAVLKRDESFRFKTSFISTVTLRQERNDAVMRVVLAKQGKHWKVEEHDGKIYFRVAQQPLPALPAAHAPVAATPEPAAVAAPVIQEEPAAADLSPEQPAAQAEPTEEPVPVSVEQTPEPNAAVEVAAAIIKPAEETVVKPQPTPVVKPAPAPVVSSARKKMRIVVDPGHGGKDPGAVRSRVREKDLNLSVSKELYRLLKKGGFEVKITRDDDTFIPLSGRSKMANNFKADLFVSVHTNSSKNRNANGFEVYFRSEKATDKEAAETAALENEAMQYEEVHYNFVDALLQSLAKNEYINESSKLAGHVRNAVYKQPGIGIAVNQNSSVRQANFYVLKGVQSPAILVEMGYISSQKDRGRLTQGAVQKKMAQGIYNGIYNYAKQEGWFQ